MHGAHLWMIHIAWNISKSRENTHFYIQTARQKYWKYCALLNCWYIFVHLHLNAGFQRLKVTNFSLLSPIHVQCSTTLMQKQRHFNICHFSFILAFKWNQFFFGSIFNKLHKLDKFLPASYTFYIFLRRHMNIWTFCYFCFSSIQRRRLKLPASPDIGVINCVPTK